MSILDFGGGIRRGNKVVSTMEFCNVGCPSLCVTELENLEDGSIFIERLYYDEQVSHREDLSYIGRFAAGLRMKMNKHTYDWDIVCVGFDGEFDHFPSSMEVYPVHIQVEYVELLSLRRRSLPQDDATAGPLG